MVLLKSMYMTERCIYGIMMIKRAIREETI